MPDISGQVRAIDQTVIANATRPSQDRGGAQAEVAVFEGLFRDHSTAILGYALRRVERSDLAADVLSEVMLVTWRRLDEVPRGDQARIWLYGVARRVILNQ